MNARQRAARRRQRTSASNEAEVNHQRSIEDAEEHNAIADVQFVMSDPRGRRVMAMLVNPIESGGMPLDNQGRSDRDAASFQLGIRQVAIELNEMIKDCAPDEWVLMQAERIRSREETT